jgi:hypothetical protein
MWLPLFQRNMESPFSWEKKIMAAGSSKTMVNIYWTTCVITQKTTI